ncbi:hypothetical protein NITLEN_40311 [Nitrospira lenta]|uniref:Uncharacterized protein n=1 Tax=Nitrospira lenta TaxID=1436998 RepID=A0A330LFM9_9BACT|nr:hypothetical protein NITLEN_40311 [Nitrospira lenta]
MGGRRCARLRDYLLAVLHHARYRRRRLLHLRRQNLLHPRPEDVRVSHDQVAYRPSPPHPVPHIFGEFQALALTIQTRHLWKDPVFWTAASPYRTDHGKHPDSLFFRRHLCRRSSIQARS